MLGISATAVVHAGGHGTAALWDAVAQGASGLRPNPLDWCDLPCWVGAVPGVDDPALATHLGEWDCRNHRLAWLALQQHALRQAVAAARGASRA